MTEGTDYFTNHYLKQRYPWRLYHRPIITALRSIIRSTDGHEMLNVGSGPFLELDEIGTSDKQVTICDIDPRAIEVARRLHGCRLRRADIVAANEPLPYADATFDLVTAMDVIEHVAAPEKWLRELCRILRPTGTLFLTTPNYASRSLRFLESTVLEIVARAQGFSRKSLHPSRMTPARLEQLLDQETRARSEISVIAFGWVVTSTTRFGGR
jgi:2-polyprenyl-3-methyl-5-hydroxy-6-metoxy-1,4-benzoquinol methylase